jgi:tetratricopeptide (TPR) repeat protein
MLGVAVLAIAIAVPLTAGAAPEGPAGEEARVAFEQARRAYNVGRWQEAADAFEKAYRLSGDPVLLYDRAQALRRAGRVDEALAGYQAYLRERPDAANRTVVEGKIRALERSRRAQGDAPLPAERLEREPTAPAPTDIADPGATASAATHPVPARRSWLPWVGVGTTVALAGAAVAMGVSVNRRFESLRDTCGRTTGCTDDQKSGLRTRVRVTNVLLALAGVSAVATGVSFFVGPREAEVAVAWRF